MKEPAQATLPVIHLNGSGPESLYGEYRKARQAVSEAADAVIATTCHQRDFYPVEGSWEKARQERMEMIQKLDEIHEYLIQWEAHAHLHCKGR